MWILKSVVGSTTPRKEEVMYQYNLPYSKIDLDENFKPFTNQILFYYGFKILVSILCITFIIICFIYKIALQEFVREIILKRIEIEKTINIFVTIIVLYSFLLFIISCFIRKNTRLSTNFQVIPRTILLTIAVLVLIFCIPYFNTFNAIILCLVINVSSIYRLCVDVMVLVSLYRKKWIFTKNEIELLKQENRGRQILYSVDTIRKANKNYYGAILGENNTSGFFICRSRSIKTK